MNRLRGINMEMSVISDEFKRRLASMIQRASVRQDRSIEHDWPLRSIPPKRAAASLTTLSAPLKKDLSTSARHFRLV